MFSTLSKCVFCADDDSMHTTDTHNVYGLYIALSAHIAYIDELTKQIADYKRLTFIKYLIIFVAYALRRVGSTKALISTYIDFNNSLLLHAGRPFSPFSFALAFVLFYTWQSKKRYTQFDCIHFGMFISQSFHYNLSRALCIPDYYKPTKNYIPNCELS